MAPDQGWTPWRRHFEAARQVTNRRPPRTWPRPDWFAIGTGLAIIAGFALCLAVVGLLDGGLW